MNVEAEALAQAMFDDLMEGVALVTGVGFCVFGKSYPIREPWESSLESSDDEAN